MLSDKVMCVCGGGVYFGLGWKSCQIYYVSFKVGSEAVLKYGISVCLYVNDDQYIQCSVHVSGS